MKGLIGRKVGMAQVIEDDGVAVPVTLVQAGPCFVTQVKTTATDGYDAVQLGFDEAQEKRLTRGQLGHLGRLKKDKKHAQRKETNLPALRRLREFRTQSAAEYELGQELTVSQFEPGDKVDVTGRTKGKGFQGTVKRYGFGGGPKTHGQSDRHRAPGSIGATSSIAHVFKGKRMPGRMGNERLTSQNLTVIRVDIERNLLAVKGTVPGPKGGLVIIRDAAKG